MLNIAYTHASVVLIIFNIICYKKQSNRYSLYSMMSVVVLFKGGYKGVRGLQGSYINSTEEVL